MGNANVPQHTPSQTDDATRTKERSQELVKHRPMKDRNQAILFFEKRLEMQQLHATEISVEGITPPRDNAGKLKPTIALIENTMAFVIR